MRNILTIDVEDWFQAQNLTEVISLADWDKYELRVKQNTIKLLAILNRYQAKATFFVLGWIAQKCPDLVRLIRGQGHEIASHGHSHQLIHKQTKQEFKEDLEKSIEVISRITKQKVRGFRAPTWSLNNSSLWALNILQDYSIEYDSSIFPINKNGFSMEDMPRFPYTIINNGKGKLIEYPLSTIRIMGRNLPFSGGGYFRLLPYSFIKWSIKQINKQGYPAVIYLHPWELDPLQPRQKVSFIKGFKHYINLHKTKDKLCRLLEDFQFSSIEEVFQYV